MSYKKIVVSIVVCVFVSLSGLGIAYAQQESEKMYPLGTVVISVLDFGKFMHQTNDEYAYNPRRSKWAPADGREVRGSQYFEMFKTPLPDLRGQFIRGLNQFYSPSAPEAVVNGRDEGVRVKKDGYSYQKQATKTPGNKYIMNKISFSDSSIDTIEAGNNVSSSHTHPNNHKARTVPENGWSQYTESGEGGDGNNQYGVRLHGKTVVQTNEINITGGGDIETRPNNIGMYFYIRINN